MTFRVLLAVVLAGAWAAVSGQSIIRVPQDSLTIQGAANAAVAGDIITVAVGIYSESVQLPDGVTLKGSGAGITIIEPATAFLPGVRLSGTTSLDMTRISGLTIRGGYLGVQGLLSRFTMIDCEVTLMAPLSGVFGPNGTGIYLFNSEANLIRTRVHRVSSQGANAPIAMTASTMTMVDSQVINNSVQASCSGLLVSGDSSILATNCLFARNTTNGWSGAAILFQSSAQPRTSRFDQCTIAENLCGPGGGAVVLNDDIPLQLTHCIVWGNTPIGISINPFAGVPPVLQTEWSDLQTPRAGVGNISQNPLFINIPGRAYALVPSSPCLGTGDPALLNADGLSKDMGRVGFFPAVSVGGISNTTLVPPGIAYAMPSHLEIDGSDGGLAGRVDVDLLSAISITVNAYAYPGAPPRSNFYLDALIGVADASTEYLIADLGCFSFRPTLLTPGATDRFTLVDSLLLAFSAAALPPASAPWSVTLSPGIPFPAQLTLQAVLSGSTSSGQFLRLSNAVIVNLR